MISHALAATFACACGWLAALTIMRHVNPDMRAFLDSKFGRSLIAAAAGALAPAVPPLVMGDTHTFRIACASAAGGLITLVALHFRSEGAS
jgi:hypothetical protein